MNGTTFERLDEAAFTTVAPEWDPLVRAMPRPSPWLLHPWLVEWWRHFGTGAELEVHVARREGRLVAALPLFVRRRRGVRVGEFLGGHESPLADLLLAPGEPDETGAALASRLAHGDAVDLFGLPEGSRLSAALGKRLRVVPRVEAPVLDLAEGWEAVYARKTSGKRRNLHRRRRKQLGELGAVEVEVAREPRELEPALEDAFRLHALRWSGRPDLSTFGSPEGQRFHRAALRALAPLDVPRIVTLRVGGRAVAFQYFFVLERTMYVHRLAFDPELGRFSPGLLNTLDALEAAAAEGAQRVEFLGGTERYKLELADRFEPLYQGLGLAQGLRGRGYVAARLASLAARRRLKRSETLRKLYYRNA